MMSLAKLFRHFYVSLRLLILSFIIPIFFFFMSSICLSPLFSYYESPELSYPPFRLIPPPFVLRKHNLELAKFYEDEGFRAARFNAISIARDMFFKGCYLGSELSCLAFNNIVPISTTSHSNNLRKECSYGVASACLKIANIYERELVIDPFKVEFYYNKACRLDASICNKRSLVSRP